MFKKNYHVSIFDTNKQIIAEKTCKTRLGAKLFVRKYEKGEKVCLKKVTLLK